MTMDNFPTSSFFYYTFDLLSTGAVLYHQKYPNPYPINLTYINPVKPIYTTSITHTPSEVTDFHSFHTNYHKKEINFVRFSAHSRYLLSGGKDNCLKLLELSKIRSEETQRSYYDSGPGYITRWRHTFYGHSYEIFDAVAHPSHELLASGGADCDVRFYNLRANEAEALLHSVGLGRPCMSLDFISRSYLAICCGMECCHIYDVMQQTNYTLAVPLRVPVTRVRAFSGGLACMSSQSVILVDQRCKCYDEVLFPGVNSFVVQNAQLAVCSQQGTMVYDLRNTRQQLMNFPQITRSVSAFQNGKFFVGLDTANQSSLRIMNCHGQAINYIATKLGKSYNLQSVEGSESDASICYVYDKSYYVCDIR